MMPDDPDDMDYCFVRLTPDKLARAIIGDVRIVPTPEQLAAAEKIIGKTGTLYRLVAGFRLTEWQKRPE
jgi:hypothetical protein